MTATLTINSFDLARRHGKVDGSFELASLPRLAHSLGHADGRLRYGIEGWIDADGHPGATLRMQALLPLTCQRCNEILHWDLDRSARFRFVRHERELEQVALDDDELDAVVGADAMDAVAWIEDEAILSLPLVPRHDDCRSGQVSGSVTTLSAPPSSFAALAALKPRRH